MAVTLVEQTKQTISSTEYIELRMKWNVKPNNNKPKIQFKLYLSFLPMIQPGLTKSRDTVTLFNLLKRDQDHVFSKFSSFKAQISGRGANNIIQEL
jgi:hypothetical protein